MRYCLPALLLSLCVALPVCAQEAQVLVRVKVSSGTGFFINREGDVVTNAHVLKNCRSVSIFPTSGERAATLRAVDDARDLAILRVNGPVPGMANLRWNLRELREGDPVVVMGYPGQEGIAGRYQYKTSTVTGLEGPTGEPHWLQLGSVAKQGNSGGPVLDTAGNVIGVISSNALIYRVLKNRETGEIVGDKTLVGTSDVAITIPALEDFLRQHNTGYYQASSGTRPLPDALLERQANRFIVPVRCYQAITP